MENCKYSGYLADDESIKRPQMRNPNSRQRKSNETWKNFPRPPSRCGFCNQAASTSSRFSAPGDFTHAKERKRKRHGSACRESQVAGDEFSDFMNFLVDEDVLDSLQNIVEDAVQKLRAVTTEDGKHLFEVVDESCSSPESSSWSVTYSHRHTDSRSTYSKSKYCTTTTTTSTTTTSASDEDWERQIQSKEQQMPAGKVCLLDKFVSRLPKPEKKRKGSGGIYAERISERAGDTYYFLQEHFHIWAKLAESFHQLPQKDYFSKFKQLPKQELSAESLHKEITNVLKRPTPSSLLYYPGHEPLFALDFLEENGMLAALQDIINEAVQKVLGATLMDGAPLFDIFGDPGQLSVPWESSLGGTDEEEEEEEEEEEREGEGGGGRGRGRGGGGGGGEGGGEGEGKGSGSGDETSEGDSKSDDGTTPGKKKKRKKGKHKKKGTAAEAEEVKGKSKYTPPPLPKSKRKSVPTEEPCRKPKYVPPPLPKTKPRPPAEEPPPKPKYTPPPLPKPRKKQEVAVVQTELEAQPSVKMHSRHVISTKDVKRAHLQARPLPKQAILDFLIENAAKLIICKYNYETILSERLGFISVPVTKVLLEIMFGYKRIKGSGIRLSSQIDWGKVSEEIYKSRPPKPKTSKLKEGDKKKAGDKKKKQDDAKKPTGDAKKPTGDAKKPTGDAKKPTGDVKKKLDDGKKSVAFKPPLPSGKVVITKGPVEKKEVKVSKPKGKISPSEPDGSKQAEIFEILPLRVPQEVAEKEVPKVEEPLERESSKTSVSITDSLVKLPSVPAESEVPLPIRKQSSLSQRLNIEGHDSKKGSTMSVLPEVEPTSQPSVEILKKISSTRKMSINGESSRKSSTILPKI